MSKSTDVMKLEHQFGKENSEREYKHVKDMTKILCTFSLCGISIIVVGFGATGMIQLIVMGIAVGVFMGAAIIFRTFGM